MDENEYIEKSLESIETLSEHTESMIQAIMGWARQGTSLQWFISNWPEIVKAERNLNAEEEESIGPWIKTWAEEAFKRVEKEND